MTSPNVRPALFGKKSYKKAIVEYSKVQETYAKSVRIPAALYRIGTSFLKINMPKDAKSFFNLLLERYPKSPEAKSRHPIAASTVNRANNRH